MSYAILGAGKVGQALATAFARKGIEVAIASRQPDEALAPIAKAIGPTVVPKTLRDAVKAEIIFLAVPFESYKDVAKLLKAGQPSVLRCDIASLTRSKTGKGIQPSSRQEIG